MTKKITGDKLGRGQPRLVFNATVLTSVWREAVELFCTERLACAWLSKDKDWKV
jgi:hypothetical protein